MSLPKELDNNDARLLYEQAIKFDARVNFADIYIYINYLAEKQFENFIDKVKEVKKYRLNKKEKYGSYLTLEYIKNDDENNKKKENKYEKNVFSIWNYFSILTTAMITPHALRSGLGVELKLLIYVTVNTMLLYFPFSAIISRKLLSKNGIKIPGCWIFLKTCFCGLEYYAIRVYAYFVQDLVVFLVFFYLFGKRSSGIFLFIVPKHILDIFIPDCFIKELIENIFCCGGIYHMFMFASVPEWIKKENTYLITDVSIKYMLLAMRKIFGFSKKEYKNNILTNIFMFLELIIEIDLIDFLIGHYTLGKFYFQIIGFTIILLHRKMDNLIISSLYLVLVLLFRVYFLKDKHVEVFQMCILASGLFFIGFINKVIERNGKSTIINKIVRKKRRFAIINILYELYPTIVTLARKLLIKGVDSKI